jgi:maltooligosyltrehalose synthase
VQTFVERTLTGRTAPAFLESFAAFLADIEPAAVTNSLAQLVLKIASPGVADFYQGTELWDSSLVDPDNRRPVDWARRQQALSALEPWLALASVDSPDPGQLPELAREVRALLDSWPDGRIKCFVTACGMRLRRARPGLLIEGDYEALTATGPAADHVVACGRRRGTECLVAIVPRLPRTLSSADRPWPLGASAWQDTRVLLPPAFRGRVFRDLLSGRRFQPAAADDSAASAQWLVRDIAASCPVALLWATRHRRSPAAHRHGAHATQVPDAPSSARVLQLRERGERTCEQAARVEPRRTMGARGRGRHGGRGSRRVRGAAHRGEAGVTRCRWSSNVCVSSRSTSQPSGWATTSPL